MLELRGEILTKFFTLDNAIFQGAINTLTSLDLITIIASSIE
jgi:hypothetical protein